LAKGRGGMEDGYHGEEGKNNGQLTSTDKNEQKKKKKKKKKITGRRAFAFGGFFGACKEPFQHGSGVV
jgi:hypothetical protein